MEKRIVIGWDLYRGSGEYAQELNESDRLGEIELFIGHKNNKPEAELNVEQDIDFWNLDPRLIILPTFFHRLRKGAPIDGSQRPLSRISATIEAWAIVRSSNPEERIRELYQLDPAELWYNGGNLPDGCQIPSGMVGLRFKVIGSHTSGGSDHDLVANLLAIPNTTLNCPDLADKLIRRLHLTLPEPHVFGATQEDVE